MKNNVLFSVALTAFFAVLVGCSDGTNGDHGGGGSDAIDFVMNEDGSAVFFLNTISVCAEYGHVTDVKL